MQKVVKFWQDNNYKTDFWSRMVYCDRLVDLYILVTSVPRLAAKMFFPIY